MKKLRQLILLVTLSGSTALTCLKAQQGLIYVAVEPCRLVDTRVTIADGAIPAETSRNFLVSGGDIDMMGQGGNVSGCPAPKQSSKPLAISAYVVAVPTSSSIDGVLTAYPSDQLPPPPGTGATVNFAAGQVIGNTTNITLCEPSNCPTEGEFAILARNTEQHVVVDVQGYFYPISSGICTANAPTRFVDNGDGTICDNQTGLMWEKKDSEDGVQDLSNPHDVDNRYTWTTTDDGNDTNPDGPVFTDFLARLNNTVAASASETPFAGHTDWRIPTLSELQTLLFEPSPCSISPCIVDPLFAPVAAPFSAYWTSTSSATFPVNAWVVHFAGDNGGLVEIGAKVLDVPVRAVRGGP